jgi:hypothetical protein
MKTRLVALLGGLLCITAASAAEEWRYQPGKVVKVTISENAAVDTHSSGAGEEDCKPFRLTSAAVRSYFRKAQAIEDTHDYQWSGCKASGSIVFANGDRGEWQINSSRLGFLNLKDGRSFAFFCRDTDCRGRAFAAWKGVNADSELED